MLDDSFEVAYLAGLVVGCAIRGVYAHPRRSRRVAKRLPTVLDSALLVLASLGFLLPLAHIFTPWLTFADYRRPAWVGGVGTGIYAGALVLLWLSHVSLGDHWSPRPEILAGHVLARSDRWTLLFGERLSPEAVAWLHAAVRHIACR